MKRLERLASLACVCVLISLVFHLLGMSFNRWKEVRSNGAKDFSHWFTSVRSRCYLTRINSERSNETLMAEFCLPNQWLMIKDPAFAEECLQSAVDDSPQLICATNSYNQDHCRCDYRARTKAVLALTILVSIALGAMLFISHALSQLHTDRILRWLVPVCFSLLLFVILSLIIILFIAGTSLHDDLHGLESLLSTNVFNETDPRVTRITSMSHQVKLGWCFGMEILALQFAVVSLVLYALMFVVKQRPED